MARQWYVAKMKRLRLLPKFAILCELLSLQTVKQLFERQESRHRPLHETVLRLPFLFSPDLEAFDEQAVPSHLDLNYQMLLIYLAGLEIHADGSCIVIQTRVALSPRLKSERALRLTGVEAPGPLVGELPTRMRVYYRHVLIFRTHYYPLTHPRSERNYPALCPLLAGWRPSHH